MKRLLTCGVLLVAITANAQTFRFYAVGGRSVASWHGQADVQAFAFELERPISKQTELGFVLAPLVVEQPVSWFGDHGEGTESIQAMHGALVLRHHFRTGSKRMQPYIELGSGPMWAEKRVPASTSRFNFITQGTAGVTLLPHRTVAFVVGYRFMHISNGGYAPRNPGLNINSLILGARVRR